MRRELSNDTRRVWAFVVPAPFISAWRDELVTSWLSSNSRFANRCDELLASPPHWVCVHPTLCDTGLEKLAQLGVRIVVCETPSVAAPLEQSPRALSANRWAQALGNIDEAIEILDSAGRIAHVNSAFERVTGYRLETVLGERPDSLFKNEFEDGLAYRQAAEAIKAGQSFKGSVIAKRANGALVHQEVTFSPLKGTDGLPEGCVILRRDISRQVRSEAALRESEKRYRVLAENATDIIWTAGMEGFITYCSPSVKRVLGISVEEALDRTLDDFLPMDSLSHLDQVEWLHECASDKVVDPISVQVLDEKADGTQIWLEAQVSLLMGPSNVPVGILGVSRDITKRRRVEAERTSLEAQLLQAQKMEAIGRLAGGIAHDFNNLLTGISVSAQLMLDAGALADATHADVEDILSASDRATRLTRQLMAFSRNQVIAPQLVDVNSVVSSFERMLSRLIGEDIRMAHRASSAPVWIEVDPIQLEQIIVNLVVNARDAMPRGGDLLLRTYRSDLVQEDLAGWDAVPGQFVVMEVRDTGDGMTEEVRAHIFEPFFTTKEAGKGTGLGLSTVYGIVKQNGGVIQIETESGAGTSFRVCLPARAAPTEAPKESPSEQIRRGCGRVLVVEDEVIVRSLARRLLVKHGYEVVEAKDGEEALLLCSQESEPFDLVLTDVVMPGMSGPRLIAKLREDQPEVKVIFMSGYVDEELQQDAVGQPGTRFMQKPFNVAALLDLVATLLHAIDGSSS